MKLFDGLIVWCVVFMFVVGAVRIFLAGLDGFGSGSLSPLLLLGCTGDMFIYCFLVKELPC